MGYEVQRFVAGAFLLWKTSAGDCVELMNLLLWVVEYEEVSTPGVPLRYDFGRGYERM